MNIQSYGAAPDPLSDTTPFVRDALRDLAAGKDRTLRFPKGRYHFWPDRAAEDYLYVSNNDESIKRIAFALTDLSDVEIDGEGSEFVFHGYVIPFAARRCRSLRLSNFTMDWERTFHSEAEVVAYTDADGTGAGATLDLRIPRQFPYRIAHGQLYFDLEGVLVDSLSHMLEFDPVRRQTAKGARDNAIIGPHTASELDGDIVRVQGRFHRPLQPGNIVVLNPGKRYTPGIVLMDSDDVSIADVTIHHCGGMGVIAQRTRGIDLQRVRVTPNLAEERMVSATADATHFVNCAGLIKIDDCLFENQLDDPVNIHGIYARVSQVLGPSMVEVELVHSQQRGIDITQAEDRVEIVSNDTLLTYCEAGVLSFERLNKQFFRLTLDAPLPPETKVGDGIASLGWIPDVRVTRCVSRNNRARGFLLSTAGKVVIEDNYFHTPGSAILIAGDANYWFESGKVRDITIRKNHFDHCLFGVWGAAVIAIDPEIEERNRGGAAYHRNIAIENNLFDLGDMRVLSAHSVDGLTFRDNVLRSDSGAPVFNVHAGVALDTSRNTIESSPAATPELAASK